MFKSKRLLLVAAHPDDIESGCGGTVSKYRDNAEAIKAIMFAPCLEDPQNAGILDEFQGAMSDLGVGEAIKYGFPREYIEKEGKQIRDILFKLRMEFNPQVVFCPSLNDLHQDHKAIGGYCANVFRDESTLLAYEVIRSTINFVPNLYITLSDADMENKIKALSNYKTQARRFYFKPEIFKAQALFRGCQIQSQYAEAFEVLRMTDR